MRNWKTLPGFASSGSEAVLQLKGAEVSFDLNSYKPVLKLSQEAGRIKVELAKKGRGRSGHLFPAAGHGRLAQDRHGHRLALF